MGIGLELRWKHLDCRLIRYYFWRKDAARVSALDMSRELDSYCVVLEWYPLELGSVLFWMQPLLHVLGEIRQLC